MPVERIDCKASDNVYLHKDFHCALNESLEYLRVNFGEPAARDYLRQFAEAYHAPLKAEVGRRGLAALREYFEKIYRIEGGRAVISGDENELTIRVDQCPAVEHIRNRGQQPSVLYPETTRIVSETICRDTPYAFEMSGYDPLTGAAIIRFYRRSE